MKRTPKNGGEKRDLIVRFRATADEITIMKQHATTDRVSVSEYIRRKLKRQHMSIDRTDFIRLLAEIGKQGSNLNQIAKTLNIEAKKGEQSRIDPKIITRTLNETNRLTGQLMEILKHGHRRKNTQ